MGAERPKATHKRSELWRRAALATLATLVFLVATAFGAVLHLGLPVARPAQRDALLAFLNGFFRGSFRIGELSRLDAFGVGLKDITIVDPYGNTVIAAKSLTLEFDLVGVGLRALRYHEKLSIVVDSARVTDGTVLLLAAQGNDDAPVPSIADAFEPRVSSQTPPSDSGRSVRIWLPNIELLRVQGLAQLPKVPEGSFEVPLLRGRLLVAEEGVAIDVEETQVKVRELLDETLELDGTAGLRFPGMLRFDLDVAAGEIQGHELIEYDQGKLTAVGSFADTPGEAIRRLLPEWPIDGEIGVEHVVEGTLPLLDIQATVRAGGGASSAKGRLRISPEIEADFDIDADSVDLSLLRHDWPESHLGLRSAVELWGQEGRLAMTWNATLLPGEIVGQTTPAIDAAGNMDEHGTRGTFTFHERGLPLHVTFSKVESDAMSFEAKLRRTDLINSPRVQALMPTRGILEGTLTGSVTPERVLLHPSFDATTLTVRGLKLKGAELRGDVEFDPTKIDEAYGNLSLNVRSLETDRLNAKDLSLGVEGPLLEPRIKLHGKTARGITVELTARTRTDKVDVGDLDAKVLGDGPPIVLTMNRGVYDSGQFEISKLVIESTGRLEADVRSGPPLLARLRGENIDLARIARVLELPLDTLSGKVTVDADLHIDKHSEGTFFLKVEQGAALGISGVGLGIDSRFEGGRFVGTAHGSVKDLGQGRASWDLELSDSPLSPNAFAKARGIAAAEVSEVQLGALAHLLAIDTMVHGLTGQSEASLKLERSDRSALPTAHASLTTQGLGFDWEGGHLENTDLTIYADVDPSRERVSIAAHVADQLAALATVSAELELPLRDWATKLPSAAELTSAITSSPIEAVYSVPERELADLPIPLQEMPALRGRVSARGVVHGTLDDPAISGSISVKDAVIEESGIAKPISLDAKVQTEPTARQLTGQVIATQGRTQIASGSVSLTFPAHSDDGPSWLGQAQMIFDGMPTDLIVPLANTGVRGTLQGAIAVSRKSLLPELSANLEIKNLSALGKRVGEGTVELRMNGARFTVDSQVEDEFGTLEAHLDGALKGTRHFAELTPGTPLVVRGSVKRFNAAVLSPVFAGVLDDFGGSLSGEANAELRAPAGENDPWRARVFGHLTLDEGEMTPTSMRLRLKGVKMNLTARPEGAYNLVEIKDLRAKARSSEENFQGQGTLYFDNLKWVGGRLSFSQTRVPILSEGIELVTLTGKGQIDFEKAEDELRVKLDVPELEAELPASSDHDLIALNENKTIQVTVGSKDVFEKPEASSGGTHVVVSIHLGDRVRVKSPIASVKLKGDPVLHYGEELTMAGSIALVPGGRIQVMGRVFIIEHGSVYFDNSDVSNPLIEITAAWRASDGVLIRASLSGRARSPKLEWSSDPPIPGGETAVVARVLGGSSNGASNTGLAYGAAALNDLLGQSGVRGVELSAQSESGQQGQMARLSERSRESYSAAFQISESVWFEGKYTQERAGPGSSPRSGFSGTIDWRFSPQWSARSEIGTLGTGIDLLWQYRY